MRICVLDEVAPMEDLLCATLELRHHRPVVYETPSTCLEALHLSKQNCCKNTFGFLIIGDHPKTSFSWRYVAEQARNILPELPILLISNTGYYETLAIEHQLQHVKVLDEPFRLKDFYAIVDGFAEQCSKICAPFLVEESFL